MVSCPICHSSGFCLPVPPPFIRTDGLWQGDAGSTLSIFYIIIAVIVLFVLVFAWVGTELARLNGRPFKYVFWLSVLRNFADIFFTGWFFVPVVGTCWLMVLPSVPATSGGASRDSAACRGVTPA